MPKQFSTHSPELLRVPVRVAGFTKMEFITYLNNTLIPDLKESGHVATAEDFETAVMFLCMRETTVIPKRRKS